MSLVGTPLPRREDARFLTGRARYLDDLDDSAALHVAFVRSIHAHARVTRLDARNAGAVAALTADDLDGVQALPSGALEGAEVAKAGHPILARGEVAYVGQPVAAVVAETRALAEDAAELVEVEYEPLEPAVDARTAPTALVRWSRSAGDVAGAFAAADHVVRASFEIPRIVTAPIEPRGALAVYEDDLLTVHCSAQDPHRPLAHLSHALGREPERIRIVVPDVGGAFGSKGAVGPEVVATAVAATKLGRPVKWAEDRLENFLAAYQGRGIAADVELALAADGRMLALRARLVADLGAYLYPTTPIPPHTAAMLLTGAYAIPAAEVEVVGARTNKAPTGPSRGAGRPEAAYIIERTVDIAARELGLDPAQLRRRNFIPRDAFPYETPLGWTYDSGDFDRCLDTALELVGPPEQRADRLVGFGVGMYLERCGGQWESTAVRLEPDGRLVVRTGSSPHGQGHETLFAQIAADELGMAPEQVEVVWGDTAKVPAGVGTFASRSTAMGGSALVEALRKLKAEGGREAEARFSSGLLFSSGAYAAVVEIDPATGELRVVKIAAVDDSGRIMNPLLAEGQVVGGTVYGLGECLVEEAVYDEDGQLRTASFADYPLLTAAELPELASRFVETPSPLNPLGAKGIGEGGSIGTLAAVGNAVVDALGGVHVDPPFTAEKLWRAIHEREER